ncbi:hypothetical protein D3C73_1442680 [compost metagenome]
MITREQDIVLQMDMLECHRFKLLQPGIGQPVGGAGMCRRLIIVRNFAKLSEDIPRSVMFFFQVDKAVSQ